jgi:hypothetical protein
MGAVIVPPIQVEVAFATEAMVMPAGRLSVNARFRTPEAVLLEMSNRNVLTLPGPMVAGSKLLLKDGVGVCANALVARINNRTVMA